MTTPTQILRFAATESDTTLPSTWIASSVTPHLVRVYGCYTSQWLHEEMLPDSDGETVEGEAGDVYLRPFGVPAVP